MKDALRESYVPLPIYAFNQPVNTFVDNSTLLMSFYYKLYPQHKKLRKK